MKKLIVAGVFVLLVITAVNARQVQSDTPRDMNSMMRMMQMKETMDKCFMNVKDLEVSVTDTKDGVAMTFTPKDPSQVERLRRDVRAHAEMMRNGGCGMTERMMSNMHHR